MSIKKHQSHFSFILIEIRRTFLLLPNKGMHLPSNGAIANAVHHALNLQFQDHKIWNVNIWNAVSSMKNTKLWLYWRPYSRWNGTIANVELWNRSLNIQDQTFQISMSSKRWDAFEINYCNSKDSSRSSLALDIV